MPLFLGLFLAATAPATPAAVLDRLGRTGGLTVASGERPRDRQKVLEIEVQRCTVVFKTKITALGFSAHMIDIGEGGKIERAGKDRIRLRGSTRFPPIAVLVSGAETAQLRDALKAVHESCWIDGIF